MSRSLAVRLGRCLGLLGVAVSLLAGPAPAQPRRPVKLDRATLGLLEGAQARFTVGVRDRVLAGAQGPVARAAFSGGLYATSTNERVRVRLSDAYEPAPEVNASVAQLFAAFPHGSELSALTVDLVSPPELAQFCGADALACYSPATGEMILPAEPASGPLTLADIAAHEYGHHVATHRSNAPWKADEWGPKRWASALGVCRRVGAGELFPGDEGEHYTRNPGEGWAETYRLLAGGSAAVWDSVDPFFFPDARPRAAALADVRAPWSGAAVRVTRTRFSRRGSRDRWVHLSTPLDGALRATLTMDRSLDADLLLYDGRGRLLARARHQPGHQTLRRELCGLRDVRLRVHRRAGAGRFTLRTDVP